MGAAGQQCIYLVGGDRLAEEVPLAEICTQRLKQGHLLGPVDALGHRVDAEPLGQLDHRLDDGPIAGVGTQPGHEAAVDLDDVDREALHVLK